ncbi:hypothetical protein D477_007349 [Arthrobacter crystallopoietes BAB-32]|uniref:Uncharacterized protein n=1 Tax=Arthrobacter crystallopoietes BAB-32 TaxID=1246476 RepID=N1V4E6_9MICC|nr:hypothetical protein D477_007349 [Arthrobacter crystallopoietes BAB-32]
MHLLFGAAALWQARTASGARSCLMIGGAFYLAFWVHGLIINRDSAANFLPVNNDSNWLHLILGLAMTSMAVFLTRRPGPGQPKTQ